MTRSYGRCRTGGRSATCAWRSTIGPNRDALFVDVVAFGSGAETCATYLAKGRQVAVTGRLIRREWQTAEGEKRSKHQVIGCVAFGSGASQAAAGKKRGDDA